MNLFGKIFGQPDENISDPRVREKEMIAKLQAIDLDDPYRSLSDEKIEKLQIRAVIEDACEALCYPLVIDQDIRQLDSDLVCIISALNEAIKHGQEMTAEWSCSALTFAIRNLRTDISDMDADLAAETMRCRVEYSGNLKLMVELCRQYDTVTSGLAKRQKLRQEKRLELDNAKLNYQTRRDSGALDIALGELETKVHAPATMSDEAMALRDELNNIHLLKASLIEVDTDINAKQLTLNNRKAEIESRRNALATPPHAVDPKLQDRINEANRIYREKLRDELNNAEKAMRDHDVHISAMTEIGNHSALIVSVTRAREIAKEMELEKYQQMLAEKQAAELQARAAENVAAIEQALREQHAEHERILEQRRNINITYEPVVNTEVNVLTEFD